MSFEDEHGLGDKKGAKNKAIHAKTGGKKKLPNIKESSHNRRSSLDIIRDKRSGY